MYLLNLTYTKRCTVFKPTVRNVNNILSFSFLDGLHELRCETFSNFAKKDENLKYSCGIISLLTNIKREKKKCFRRIDMIEVNLTYTLCCNYFKH